MRARTHRASTCRTHSLVDPPLEQVVAKSVEAGVDGSLDQQLRWHLGAFQTVNHDDILFQTTGGARANVGFFQNVGDTRRAGVELNVSPELSRVSWFLNSHLSERDLRGQLRGQRPPTTPCSKAIRLRRRSSARTSCRFQTVQLFPVFRDDMVNAGMDFSFNEHLSVGADVAYRTGVYLRGDEVNLLDKTASYCGSSICAGEYRFGDSMAIFARIENVLDKDYETFGLLGEPQEGFPRLLRSALPRCWTAHSVRGSVSASI